MALNAAIRYVRLAVGEELFSFDMGSVHSVQRAESVKRVEQNDYGLMGSLRFARFHVPIFFLSSLLKKSSVGTGKERAVVVLQHGDEIFGVAADSVTRVNAINAERCHSLPHALASPGGAVDGLFLVKEVEAAKGEDSNWRVIPKLSPELLNPERPAPLEDEAKADEQTPAPSEIAPARASSVRAQSLIAFSNSPDRGHDDVCLFALSMSQVVEIINPRKIWTVPGSPPHALGAIVWRDLPVPVVQLPTWVGLAESPTTTFDRFLIARGSGPKDLVAIGIDASVRTLRLPFAHKQVSTPNEVKGDHVLGVFEVDSSLLLVPNLAPLFPKADGATLPLNVA